MSKSNKLADELTNVLQGEPWHGQSIYEIFDRITFDTAYGRPVAGAHNIAEILLHMLSWTEEVMDRMNGMRAGLPSSGNWPEPGAPDEKRWQNWIEDIKLASVNLLRIINEFPEEQWQDEINHEDAADAITVTTYEGLIHGFIQHQIYHAGQIALLAKG